MPGLSRRSLRNSALALICFAGAARAGDARLESLAAAYLEKIAGIDGTTIVFRDGTRMPAGTADPDKPFDRLLRDATVLDQFRLAYPRGAPIAPPPRDFDPGRFRDEAFFSKLYGDCRKARLDLEPVTWVGGERLPFARANGAAARLRDVAADIERLPPAVRSAAYPSAGTFSCRPVRDTGRLSMHSYGAAIDLNLRYSNYWLWESHGSASVPYRNAMPREIVDAFERHGFIWGGRWYHYDTMHFEYRPELLPAALARPAPAR
jgi:hypothetical protein